MASLWNKMTSSNKPTLPSDPVEAFPKGLRKQSISARSRKALSLILPNVYGDSSEDQENAPAELGCEEAGNYPVYDPANPNHNTACRLPKSPHSSRSWSPLKPPLKEWAVKGSPQSKSASPNRMLTSSRKALNDFANTVRAKTASARPSTPPEFLRDQSPMSRDSEKSLKSKKSVHWRSSDTIAIPTDRKAVHWRSSDTIVTNFKDIPKHFSPVLGALPDIRDLDQHFLGSAIALTARPPPTPVLAALAQFDEKSQSVDLQRPVFAECEQPPLPTPMPGTNLPLEDPFDDNAAISDKEFKMFENSILTSKKGNAALVPTTDIPFFTDITPIVLDTMSTLECLERSIPSRAASHTYDADNDTTTSDDTDDGMYTLTRVHPKPPHIRRHGNMSTENDLSHQTGQKTKVAFPEISVLSPAECNARKGHLGTLQTATEVGSSINLGSQLQDSDKENQRLEEGQLPSDSNPGAPGAHIQSPQACRASSLTSVALQAAPLVTNGKRLRSYGLQANVILSALQRDRAAFRWIDSSDEQSILEPVDDTEESCQAQKKTLDVKGKTNADLDGRSMTPSPAMVPLPETPMPAGLWSPVL